MLEVEFEAVEGKKRQLERVVERAKHWRFPLKGDRVLAWTGEVVASTWEGCVNLTEDYGDRAVRLRSVQAQEGTADLKAIDLYLRGYDHEVAGEGSMSKATPGESPSETVA
ncbi:hypothetical protein EPUS_03697 [Endocarpon pusillum Z07020]|uniref:Uncharacterized protein n=1 Tax=Endocarpon pusillum (strain Z07020 / HMAS-L-300199) TaxID=1263415 RepID=U1HHS3_ENDPU|nr:uncharacterized protein EPUS_03697 [Endocarpon pusillum Z07020]ERF69705.1 hypothetical protein EPUS_03697 [Endocarpon pusillum Z07020]